MDLYKYTLKGMQQNNDNNDEERKRKQRELEQRTREQQTKRKQERIEAQTKAMEELAKADVAKKQLAEQRQVDARNKKFAQVEEITHPTTNNYSGGGRSFGGATSSIQPLSRTSQAVNSLPQSNTRQAYKNWYENDYKVNDLKKYNDYGRELRQDFRMSGDYAKANGLSEQDTIKLVTPESDTRLEDRLKSIADKVRSSEGNNWLQEVGQSIQEGWYEKEVSNILSKESFRQSQGLPNKVDKVNKFIEDNPDLFTQENGRTPYQLLRGSTGVFRQGYDNIKETFQDPGTYLVIAGIYGMSYAYAAAATAVTGGVAALPAFGTATAAATKASTLYALGKGMSYGSFKNMAELETGSSYLELREEGVPHEIAKPLAQTVGAINGMIEFAQIDTALGMIPGFDTAIDAVKQQATKDATKKVLKVLGNYGVDLGGNIVEELLQGSYSYAGVELGKYLKDTPEPNTMEALESMGKMFSDEEYWREMKDTAKSSFYSFALTPVLSSSARYASNKAVDGISNRLEQNYVNEYSDEDYKAAQKQRESLKEVITAENGITDKLIQRVNETLDPEAIALLVSEKQILESHMNRTDATNQEKALFQDTVEKVNNVLSKVMYDAKDENPNIEYRPTNRQDVELEVATIEFAESNLDTINPRFNVTAVEYYNIAKDSGTLGTIKAGLKEGKEKSKIVNEITKSLPKKERSPINVMAIVNAVETVESEIDSQIVMNNMYNLQQVQENLPDISVDANVVPETNENIIEATEQPVGEETEGNQPTNQIEGESSAEELTEPPSNIETKIGTDETETVVISEETTKEYSPSNIIKVPVNKILVDAERFQFRYEQGSDGTTTRLADTEWNQDIANADNVLLWEDEYGDLYMVNGHHRLSLAKTNGVTDLNAKILSSKEVDAETARATGAMINIAQGHATSIDVAKVIKDIGITLKEMQKQGIPPKSKIAKDGYALSQLENWLFTQVATRAFPIERAVIIGNQLGDNKPAQRQIVREVMDLESKGKPITNGVLNELIAATKGTAQVTGTQQTLMGEMQFIKDVGVERAELADYVKTQLRSRVSVLKNVTKEKNAKMLEELGNTIALDDNVKDMNAAEQALWIIDKTLNYQGTKINELFNELAQELAQAEPKDRMRIKKKALDLVTKMMEGGNLLSETINQRTKREDVKDSIARSKRDGTEGIESSPGEQFITREQEELVGQASILQMKEMPQVEVTTKSGAKSSAAYKATVRVVEALQKNVFFNGLKVDYTNETGKVNYSKEELIRHGYGHLEENKEYVVYGQYDNRTRTITLNQGATRDTILEEAIHDIQARINEINPTLGVLITEWENEVKAKALEQGIEIPDGYELLAKAMVYSELGYASTDRFMAETIAVDDDIASGIKSILGDEVLAAGIGLVESKTDKADRVLRAEYEDYADRIFMQDGFLDSLQEAQEVRMNEIKKELENAKALIYHHPSNGTYVIVSPSTKGAKYQVTYFDREGPFMDTQNDNIDDIAKSLADEMYFYKGEEIHYQLKKVNRSVADELYGIAISRGYRTDNNGNRNRISFELTDNQIVNAYHDSRVGNFSAQDFDKLIKDNKDVPVRVKNDIIRGIFEAAKKGLDVDNEDVTFLQYLHRFYGMPIGKGLYEEDVITYKNEKIVITEREYAQADREEILAGKDPFKNFVIGSFDTLEEALNNYKMWMNRDVKQTLDKDFIYLDYKEIEKIEKDYENFRDNVETYRNKGIETEFTGEPHYVIRYELDGVDVNEFATHFNNGQVLETESDTNMYNVYDPNINYQLKDAIDNINQYVLETPDTSYNAFVNDNLTTTLQYKDNTLYEGVKGLEVDKEVEGYIYELVVKDAVMGGYDYLKMADNDPLVITNEMIEEVLSEKPIFQLKELPETNGELLAVHNLKEEELKNVIKLGGFPMPSIAVVKSDYDHNRYGEISVLFGKDTIDPKASRYNKVYGGDAYTPTFPSIEYKMSKEVSNSIEKRVYKAIENTEYAKIFNANFDIDNISNKVNNRGSFSEAYSDDALLMLTYLNEKGIPFEPVIKDKNYGWDLDLLEKLQSEFKDVIVSEYISTEQADLIEPRLRQIINEYYQEALGDEIYKEPLRFGQIDRIAGNIYEYSKDTIRTEIDKWDTEKKLKEEVNKEDFTKWLNEISEGIIEKEGFRNNKDYYTPSGNPRSWEALHDEVTLDKVVKAMRGQDDVASEGFSGIGKFIAASSKMYKSIEQMKQDSDRLISIDEEGYSEIKKEYSDRLLAIADRTKNTRSSNSFMALDRATEAIIDAVQNAKSRLGVLKILQEYNDINVTDSALDDIMQLSQDASNMPTEYFEAKPKRAVYINEIAAVIAPNTISPETEQMLRDNGINLIEKYSPDEDRQVAIDRVLRQNDVSFQLKEAWVSNKVEDYYQLKENSDMEERSWGQTIRDANITEQWLTDLLTSNKFMYEVKHNQDTMIAAAQLIDSKGEEYVEARLLSDLDNDAVLMAASQILTYKYMESGEQDRAMTMLDKTAEKATSLGQAIQILSVWGRQTPEGMLRYTSQAFRKGMTDKDRQVILDKTKALTEEFNKLNRQAIKEIDLVGTIKQVQEMKPDERLARDVASRGETLPDGFTPEMLKPFENTIDDDMAQRIIDVVNRHYQDGKGNLKDKLGDLGLNDFETEILDKYIKQKVKEATRDSKQAKIDKELKKQKYERKGIDEQILDLTSEGKIDENLLKNLVGEKEGMPVLNKELVDYIYQQGQYINSLPQGRERDIETGKMIQTISDQMPVSFWTKVKTFQTIAQLLNFKTTIRNLVGNDMFRRLDTFTLNFLGTPIDAALAKATGHSRTMLFRPINANKAQKLGYKEGWRLGLEDALLGINTSDENTQYELRRTRVFTSGILGEAEKVLNIALRATDRAAVMATFRDSLTEQMELAKADVATDEMTENAMAIALYRTFQDDTTLSQMFSTLKRGLNKIGSKDGEFGLGELIMKYPKTPANILGRAIDYSPAGVVVTALKLARDTSPKGSYVRQRMATEGLSRAIMGTGLIATGAILAKMGILTGSNPDDDEDIYKLEKAYGLRDFSVNVSAIGRHIISGFTDSTAGELRKGDTIASYDWAEPIAMGLAVGADTELGKGEALSLFSTIVRALETGATALADQPLLSGVANLFRYGDPIQGLTQVVKGIPSSFTPTLFAHVAQFMDGRDTDPYTFYGTGRQAYNMVANRVPGLRNTLPSRYTTLGDEKRYYPEDQNFITTAINTFLNPAITSKYMPPKEAEFLFDLYNGTGDGDIVPRSPQKSYTIDKVKYSFTPESWEEMSKWLGGRYREEIGYAMNTYMRSWSPEEQADEIEYLIKQVKEEARKKAKEIGTKVE